jgi:heme-degrading monooxygenase HmoA
VTDVDREAPALAVTDALRSLRVGAMTLDNAILEHAVLDVRPGEEERFEAAFEQARSSIASAAGFRGLRLERCIEAPSRYLLLVEWERLEDHVEGFRESPAFERWRSLLHHFYDPFPLVEHFRSVVRVDSPG